MRALRIAAAAVAVLAGGDFSLAHRAAAQDAVATFYRGKNIELVVGSTAGGGYDTYARLIARHIGRHVPGNPNIVVQNMPGAGGNKATAFVYGVAPRDGSVIAAVFPGAILEPLLGDKGQVGHDPSKLGFVGSANEDVYLCFGRKDAGWSKFEDLYAREMIVAASAEGGTTRDLPALLNNVLGTKFKIVSGYPGNREMALAVEKGEVEGQCGVGWSAIMAQRPQWIRDQYITLLAQESIKGLPFLNAAGVPLTTSFAKSPEDRQVLELVYSQAIFGRPYVVGPGVPAERLAALQKAFTAALTDPALKEEAERAKLDLDYVSGPEVQALVAKAYATPPHIVERAKRALIYRP
jgi:tripartite-type tricarboxylate transporter receptor subunit TctC